jgi:hypothetical protein
VKTNFDLNRRASPRPYLGEPAGESPAVSRRFCECHTISSVPRFQPPPRRDLDFTHSGPVPAAIVLESDGVIGACSTTVTADRPTTSVWTLSSSLMAPGVPRDRRRGLVAAGGPSTCRSDAKNDGLVRFYEKPGYGAQNCVALGKQLDDRTDRSMGNRNACSWPEAGVADPPSSAHPQLR